MKKGLLHLTLTALVIGGVAFFVQTSGCGRSGDDHCAQCDRAPTPIDPAETGTIRGVVRFEGPPPRPGPDPRGGSPECAGHAPKPDTPVLVSDGRLANVIVSVKSGLGDRVFAVPQEPVVIDNLECFYVPRVATAQAHQIVRFRNSDSANHNIHGFLEGAGVFNRTLTTRGTHFDWRFHEGGGMARLKCDLHPWMIGWLGIYDHPFHRVTASDGSFELTGVPAGEVEIAAWHEIFGERVKRVRVEAGKIVSDEFVFTPK